MEQPVNEYLVGERGHVNLAVDHSGRCKFSEHTQGIAGGILIAVPQLCQAQSVKGAQNSGSWAIVCRRVRGGRPQNSA